ncbi:MAG: protein TonB [Sulfurimonas sp.]|jgi:protein TonB|uniref:TonB C-terminal domain-containing protein n=1 Tax=Sulfurimonas sp. TaxID=2022749 RepID=UPI0039E357C1
MMFSASKMNTYALKKDDFISVSLEIINIPTKKIIKEAVAVKEEPQAVEEVKEVDIGDLFSDVWTKDIKLKKKVIKKIDNKRLERIQKKIKTSENNEVQLVEKNINNTEATVTDTQSKTSSSADEVNEYLAKIQAIVYRNFEPPANSEGYKVIAVIELSAIGRLIDFRVLTYSPNQGLNKESDKIKNRLLGVIFPINPNNKSTTMKIPLISDK